MTNASRTTVWQIVRALVVIAVGAVIIVSTFKHVHSPQQPYYAQLAAKAAAGASATVSDGDTSGYTYNRDNSK